MQSPKDEIMNFAEKASLLLRIPPRLIASWWVSENGWVWRTDNNPGNISYTGEGNPDPIGVFAGVVEVQSNKACVYKDPAYGVNAFVLLLELPLSAKELTLTSFELRNAKDVKEMCQLIGRSNWASSHYQPVDSQGIPIVDSWQGESIWQVYTCQDMNDWYGVLDLPELTKVIAETPTVKTTHSRSYVVIRGETLDSISKRFLIPVEVLVAANGIKNANEITVGEVINIPLTIRVRVGDTLTKIADQNGTTIQEIVSLNHIQNPNFIRTGQTLYVL